MQRIARAAHCRHRTTEGSSQHTGGAWRANLDAALAYCDVHAKCSAHDTLVALGGHFWHQGLATDDLQALLLDVNRRLYRRNRRGEIRSIVRWLARRPRDGTNGRRRGAVDPGVTQFLADARSAIAAWPWRGRAGKTDRAVVEAHLLIAETWRSPIHEAAERLVAALANVKRPSVWRSHGRLVDAGWLEPLRAAYDTHGQLWRLQIPAVSSVGNEADETAQNVPIQSGAPPGADWTVLSGFKVGALGHPLFREGQGGLGKSVGALLDVLDHRESVRTQVEWARLANSSTATIRRWERTLFVWKLIGKAGKRGYVRGPASYDEVAARLGLDELARREKAHYAEETAEHREWLATHQRHEREVLAQSMQALDEKRATASAPSSSSITSDGPRIYVLRRPAQRGASTPVCGAAQQRAAP